MLHLIERVTIFRELVLIATLLITLAKMDLEWVLRQMDIGPAGYFVLFALLFACGLGLPLPEDIPLLVAGALIGQGHMNWIHAGILAWCGIIGGDCVLYTFGRKFGLNITKVPVIGTHVTRERILHAERLFEKWGVWVVAVGRLFAGIRGAMVIAAGTIRFHFLKFLIADGLAAVVSGGLFLFLGEKFGEHLPEIQEKIHKDSRVVFAIVAVLVVGIIAYAIFRKRHHSSVAAVALDKVDRAVEKHQAARAAATTAAPSAKNTAH